MDDEIVGIFADKAEAVAVAEGLLRAVRQSTEKPESRFHKSPWTDWFAMQKSLAGVFMCDKETEERVVVEPPKEWGRNWAWNIAPDGSGIVMQRTT